jgi:hypothetical protein
MVEVAVKYRADIADKCTLLGSMIGSKFRNMCHISCDSCRGKGTKSQGARKVPRTRLGSCFTNRTMSFLTQAVRYKHEDRHSCRRMGSRSRIGSDEPLHPDAE